MNKESLNELTVFIDEWKETSEGNKKAFLALKEHLESKNGVSFDYAAREGLTYSLRAVHENQKDKDLFVMVDVIEDDPRWLSVCFYGDMVTDPDELGDFVPEGLLGEDAMCFDIDEWEDGLVDYVKARLDDAVKSAAG